MAYQLQGGKPCSLAVPWSGQGPRKMGPAVASTIDEGETYDDNIYKAIERLAP